MGEIEGWDTALRTVKSRLQIKWILAARPVLMTPCDGYGASETSAYALTVKHLAVAFFGDK